MDSKIICVTGATSGIGKSTAKIFAKNNWKVIATGRRQDRLTQLSSELGNNCLPLCFDVSDKKAVNEAFSSLPKEFQPIDVLINNAGAALGLDTSMDASIEDWETMVNSNILGLLYCTKAVIKQMAERKKGTIVNIASIAAYTAYKGANVYGSTKAFVCQFSRNLRCDLHGSNVRVCNIEPGMLESEFSLVRFKGDAKRADTVYADCQPLTPDDLADIIYFAVNTPQHVNIGRIQVMPTCQSETGTIVYKS